MAMPAGRIARNFYRCCWERLEDAENLLANNRNTGAVYLAGYSVECILKAMLLTTVPVAEQPEIAEEFRGNRAHDFDWLRSQYLERGGATFPEPILESLMLLDDWSTLLRYDPKMLDEELTATFFSATHFVVEWADGRL
jgi:HEPN domain-containing protein